jgi:hypothetical protein
MHSIIARAHRLAHTVVCYCDSVSWLQEPEVLAICSHDALDHHLVEHALHRHVSSMQPGVLIVLLLFMGSPLGGGPPV